MPVAYFACLRNIIVFCICYDGDKMVNEFEKISTALIGSSVMTLNETLKKKHGIPNLKK